MNVLDNCLDLSIGDHPHNANLSRDFPQNAPYLFITLHKPKFGILKALRLGVLTHHLAGRKEIMPRKTWEEVMRDLKV